MDFRPLVADPKPMDERLFRAAAMGLEAMLLDRPLADRFTFDAARSMLFIDFAGYRVQQHGAGRGGAGAGASPGRAARAQGRGRDRL